MADQKARRSRGSEKLERLFSPRVVTKTALAESLNVSPQTIWIWVRGFARPKLEHMILLKKRFGIHPEDWATPPKVSDLAAPPAPRTRTLSAPPAPRQRNRSRSHAARGGA